MRTEFVIAALIIISTLIFGSTIYDPVLSKETAQIHEYSLIYIANIMEEAAIFLLLIQSIITITNYVQCFRNKHPEVENWL